MITLSKLIIENFGIYKGLHSIDLMPESNEKSVVLLGGLNGGGKTTFLDAIQLSLYGKFARISNRKELSYENYLAGAINKHADEGSIARLELEFLENKSEQKNHYCVCRRWSLKNNSVDESVIVRKNGAVDDVLSEHWYSAVDEFMPREVASLFFFDGEKIEELATPENSSRIIRTGINALLGLGLVERLGRDLKTIEIRTRTEMLSEKQSDLLTNLNQELSVVEKHSQKIQSELASKETELDSRLSEEKHIREQYQNLGGELYEHRESHEKTASAAKLNRKLVEDSVRGFVEGATPLYLVRDLIGQTIRQAEKEQATILNRSIIHELEQRDKTILEALNRECIDSNSLELLSQLLQKELAERHKIATLDTVLDISPVLFAQFDESYFEEILTVSEALSKEHAEAEEELITAERVLSAIPDSALIQGLEIELESIVDKIEKLKREISVLEGIANDAAQSVRHRKSEIEKLQYEQSGSELKGEVTAKKVAQSELLRRILQEYEARLIKSSLSNIEQLLTTCFKTLARKSDLINKIALDSENFTATLVDKDGQEIPAEKLSAGERQLFAISILWALGQASEYSLPVVIDTPLGRLDSKHRRSLLHDYFPNASHQVILLSTDEEIDQDYRDVLEPAISKEYHIQYVENKRSSTITEGYF